MFYPDVKEHISPSALQSWHNTQSAFRRSYFEGQKTPETFAMRDGKKIHALFEGGFIEAKKRFEVREKEIVILLENGVKVLGIPDSRQEKPQNGLLEFSDLKTGKEDNWSSEMLPADLKMKTTAWLVYQKALEEGHEVEEVKGYIEFLRVEWDSKQKENVPIEGEETKIYWCSYKAGELENFTGFILKTIEDINAEYEKFLAGTVDLVEDYDVVRYNEINEEIAKLSMEQDAIKERIAEQMTFGLQKTLETEFGTFYFTEKKKYEYPPNLKIGYLDMGLVLEDAEKIASALSASKKNYELEAEPISVTRSLAYRSKTKKKSGKDTK